MIKLNEQINIITKDAQDKSNKILKLQEEISSFKLKELKYINEGIKIENEHNLMNIKKYNYYL